MPGVVPVLVISISLAAGLFNFLWLWLKLNNWSFCCFFFLFWLSESLAASSQTEVSETTITDVSNHDAAPQWDTMASPEASTMTLPQASKRQSATKEKGKVSEIKLYSWSSCCYPVLNSVIWGGRGNVRQCCCLIAVNVWHKLEFDQD